MICYVVDVVAVMTKKIKKKNCKLWDDNNNEDEDMYEGGRVWMWICKTTRIPLQDCKGCTN